MLAQTVELSALVTDLEHLTRENTPHREPVDLRTVVEAAFEGARLRGPELIFDVELGSLEVLRRGRSGAGRRQRPEQRGEVEPARRNGPRPARRRPAAHR